jgi:hypothetical protein
MYAEIGTIKNITISQYDKDVHLYCDAIMSKKLAIDVKDSLLAGGPRILQNYNYN